MARRFVDAHCHLQDPRLRAALPDVLRRATKHGLTHICTCSCNEAEWNDFPSLPTDVSPSSPSIVPAFGLHPWYAGDASPTYLDALRSVLLQYPRALIGELGLCKSRRGKEVPIDIQELRCREQLHLAEELHRPVVLHCVGAHGRLLNLLTDVASIPHAIMHAYSGSVDMVHAFKKFPYPVYFSFTAKQCVHLAESAKLRATLAAVPANRLLLETDAPDQRPLYVRSADAPATSPGIDELMQLDHNEPAAVTLAVEYVAQCSGRSVDDVATQVYANAVQAHQLCL